MWGILLGEVQCLPVDDCPAASCDSGALARESENTSFYSAILVNPPPHLFLVSYFFKPLGIILCRFVSLFGVSFNFLLTALPNLSGILDKHSININ